jgi:hypothetical protein
MVLSFEQTGDGDMTEHLKNLLEAAKKVVATPEEKEAQRRSIAYGYTKIENSRITREMVDSAADAIGKPKESPLAVRNESECRARIRFATAKPSKPNWSPILTNKQE